MQTKTIKQEDLLDEKRVNEIVADFQRPREAPHRIIDRVLHDVGLGGHTIYPGKITHCVLVPEKGMRFHIRRPAISTHDYTRSEMIPYKDQSVNLMNNTVHGIVSPFVPLSQFPNEVFELSLQSPITVHLDCKPILYEHVLREYIAETNTETSLYWKYFKLKERNICGHKFPNGLMPNQKLSKVYDTPSTKEGHDVSVPAKYLFEKNLVSEDDYTQTILPMSLVLYKTVSEYFESKNLILVDTKLEFGRNENKSIVITDELPTAESARIWLRKSNGKILCKGGKPVSFSKQFARNFAKGIEMFTTDQENQVAVKYIITTQLITGKLFEPITDNYEDILRSDLQKVLSQI